MSAETITAVAFAAGLPIGWLVRLWAVRLTPLPDSTTSSPSSRGMLAAIGTALGTALVFALVAWADFAWQALTVESVPLDVAGRGVRLAYHLVLVALLVTATITDFRDYVIPDGITAPGVLIGLGGAAAFGGLHLVPLWIDWNVVFGFGPQDPYVPAWISERPHLHGLAWSAAGLATGAGVTWLIRCVSRLVLGQEALGFGDVTLMAMIGSFLGWQPTLLVLAVAPLCGVVIALAVAAVSPRGFVGFGPYLAAGTIVVLCTWRRLWTPLRNTFGDWISLTILGGVAFIALLVLLALARLYRTMPVRRE